MDDEFGERESREDEASYRHNVSIRVNEFERVSLLDRVVLLKFWRHNLIGSE